MWTLSCDNVASYLVTKGLCVSGRTVQVEPLPGGVSNIVLAARCGDEDYVLKQALPRLQVEDEWLSDVERIEREVECQKFLIQLLGDGVIPRVVSQDPRNHIYVMKRAPRNRQNWKELLLAGQADPRLAHRAGELLGIIHNRTAHDVTCARVFCGKRFFEQLRLDPYYNKAAEVHPHLRKRLLSLAQELLQGDLCLVHGDYSPKNMLVRDADITLVDFEVGHYGNPVFDLGFLVTHLFLKTLKNRDKFAAFINLVPVFWKAYASKLTRLDASKLEAAFLPHLGAILLARVDGKSKVNYLSAKEQDWVRWFAPTVVTGEFTSLSTLLESFEEGLKNLRRG